MEKNGPDEKIYSQPVPNKTTPTTSDVKGKGAALSVHRSFWSSAWVAGMLHPAPFRISGLSLLPSV